MISSSRRVYLFFLGSQETNFNAWLPMNSGEAIPLCSLQGGQESPLSRRTPLWFPKVNGAGQAASDDLYEDGSA